MDVIKAYRPENNSLSSGQVLQNPYEANKARVVVREMADMMALGLVDKGLVTDRIGLTIGYDIENLTDPERKKRYNGEIMTDRYGRKVPKFAHGTADLGGFTSSANAIISAVTELFDRIADSELLIRRLTVDAEHVLKEADAASRDRKQYEQLDLFTDYAAREAEEAKREAELESEKNMQRAVIGIKKKYGNNAILKGMNYQEGATGRERNQQIGGHRA